MIRSIIVEDELHCQEKLSELLERLNGNISVLKRFQTVSEAQEYLESSEIDLVFLDVELKGGTAFELLRNLKEIDFDIIFTTAHNSFAQEAFEYSAVHYLLKPIAFDRFLQATQKVLDINTPKIIEKTKEIKSDYMFVRADRKMVKINFSDVLYIESLGDYVKIFTETNTIVTRESISNLELKMPLNNFIRIHRSYIVSTKQITSYTNEFIEISKKAIPISRSYKESVLQKLAKV